MAKQSEGTYYLSAYEITREQHRYLKLGSALSDCSIKDFVTKKLFNQTEMKAVARRAQIIVDLHDGLDAEPDTEADTEQPEIDEDADMEEPEPPTEADTPPDIPTPQPKRKRSKAARKSAFRRDPKPPTDSAPTPVTDSLTDAERAHILEALAANADSSYQTDDGWGHDEEPEPRRSRKTEQEDPFDDGDIDEYDDPDSGDEEGDPEELEF